LSAGDELSPIDGRYRDEVASIRDLLSEKGLFYERARVELLYLKALESARVFPIDAPNFDPETVLKSLPSNWYEEVKGAEKNVGHDVKALELVLRKKLDELGYTKLSPIVHLGLTSDDVNNLAYARLLLKSMREVVKHYSILVGLLSELAVKYEKNPMLARTHGMPAEPTTFGKEMAFFSWRISMRVRAASKIKPYGKLGGAVGNHNALVFLRPDFDWILFSQSFVRSLGLDYAPLTKQTVPYEGSSDMLHQLMLLNYITQELARDLWTYNMLGLVSFERKGVSSSTMPHKVNPVDLEDAEGQVDASNSLLSTITYKLVQTRLQRDLSDSPVRRLLGQAIAHSLIACDRVIKSLQYMRVNTEKMADELMCHPEILSEAVQVSLRLQGDEKGYEKVQQGIGELELIRKLVKGELGERLSDLKPTNYLGIAPRLARLAVEESQIALKEAQASIASWPQ